MYHHPCGIALEALQTQKKDFQRFFSMIRENRFIPLNNKEKGGLKKLDGKIPKENNGA